MPNFLSKHRQTGTALVMVLVLLLVVTLLALGSMRTANLQFLMAGNTQQHTVALIRAENALLLGQGYISATIKSPSSPTPTPPGSGYYRMNPSTGSTGVDINSASPWITTGEYRTGGAANERYIIEYLKVSAVDGGSFDVSKLGQEPGRNFYRLTGYGVSDKGAQRKVQQIVVTAENPK